MNAKPMVWMEQDSRMRFPDNSQLYATEPPPVFVRPDEQFYYESSDTISKEYLDLQIAKGEPLRNNVWLPIENSTQHLFSFETINNSSSIVDIHSAGASGQDAQTSVVADVNGKITGIHITDPGRYFFNINESDGSVPEEYQQANVLLPDGQSMKANIIWEKIQMILVLISFWALNFLRKPTLIKPLVPKRRFVFFCNRK